MIYLLLDAGHGDPPLTGGKCSPDGRLKEYTWAREMVQLIAKKARAAGIQTEIITPETTDIALNVRTSRVNALCRKYGAKNCVLISVHINAAGADGKWHDATGFSGWSLRNLRQTLNVSPQCCGNTLTQPDCAAIAQCRMVSIGQAILPSFATRYVRQC